MKLILAPDSFKGTLSAVDVARIMKQAIEKRFPYAEAIPLPIADGGEGTVDAFLCAGSGERVRIPVHGPFMEKIFADYAVLNDGETAVIEMAAAAGLPLAGKHMDPELATTYGVGELIADAARRGCREILLGLGGSATNDMGFGCAAALGAIFYDAAGNEFLPTGGTLRLIERIDAARARERLFGVARTAICDIDNPLYGESGAAYVFAPQKGADTEMVRRLDAGLRHAAGIIERDLGLAVASMPGAGAAGGMGGGMAALLGFTLRRGIDAVLDAARFETLLEGASCVFTGEGRLDGQSVSGKAVSGVVRRANAMGVPVIVVAGTFGDGALEMLSCGAAGIYQTCEGGVSMEELRKTAAGNLSRTMEHILCSEPLPLKAR